MDRKPDGKCMSESATCQSAPRQEHSGFNLTVHMPFHPGVAHPISRSRHCRKFITYAVLKMIFFYKTGIYFSFIIMT